MWRQKDELLKVLPIEQSVKNILEKLDRSADIIVLMTHEGFVPDIMIANTLPRIDIIFGGHEHTVTRKLFFNKENQTIVQHSGFFGQHIGEVIIKWDGKKIIDRRVRLIDITKELPESTKVKNLLNKYLPILPEKERVSSTNYSSATR